MVPLRFRASDASYPQPRNQSLRSTCALCRDGQGVFALQLSRSLFCPGVVSDARQFAGLSVLNPGESEAQASVTLRRADGQLFVGQDVTNPQTITLAAGEQKTFLAADLFGADRLTGSLEIASSDSLLGFASAGTWDRSELAGIELESRSSTSFVFAEVDPGITSLFLFDPYALEARVSLELIDSEGNRKGEPTSVTNPPMVPACTPWKTCLKAVPYCPETMCEGAVSPRSSLSSE